MLESWPQPALVDPVWLTAFLVMIPWLVWWHRRSLQHHSRRQLRLLLALRIVIVLLLVLRLAGLRLETKRHDVFVVFAADQSLSIDQTAAENAHQFIREATQNVAPHSFAILPFSRTPAEFVSETDLHSAERLKTLSPKNSDWASATDLGSAIVTASAAFPADKVARIVLLSDGNQTQGDLPRAALAGGIPVWTVPLPASQAPEIMVSSIDVPNRVAPGETFHVDAVVDVRRSPDDQSVAVMAEVLGGDKVVFSEEKRLTAGENRIRVPLRLQESSLITLRVTPSKLTVADSLSSSAGESVRFPDTLSENNACSGYAFVRPGREVLLIDGQPENGGHLHDALQAEGIPVVIGSLADLRPLPTGHGGPGMIILSGIPANQLTLQQMIWLRDYVGRRGGGFLMLGGDQSFGPGGYYRTVIEEILPVACDFDRERERPDLAMMLVIDKSGSMGGPKIELAKDAAKAAVELLSEHDQIGITTFDGSPYVVSPLSMLSSPREVLDRISSIEVGGGTNLYPALQQAKDALLPASARLKHVVVLTDGYSKPGDYESLTRSMTAASITVSAVGVGDSDPELMQLIARVGQGRYYYAGDPAAVPQIFARETVLAGRAAVREEPFVPQVVRETPVLADIDMVSAPPLLGHVMTRHRPSAEQILTTPAGDPLLTWWRFGLGMSAAFTSDAGGRWAADWVSWEHYSRFWSQVVRHCVQNSEPTGLATSVTDNGLLSTIKVIAVDRDDGFLNRAEIQIRVVDPDGHSATYEAGQTAPGEYQVQVEMRKTGAWQYHVTAAVGGITRSDNSYAHVVGYSDEFRQHEVNVDLLRTIALSTGGQYAPNASDVFQQSADQFVVTSRSVYDYLTLAVLLLFVLDVALQRVRRRSRISNG